MLKNLLNIFFPAKCLSCNELLPEYGFCVPCFNKITFSSSPCCAICSHPFEIETNEKALCGVCIKHTPYFDKAFYLFKYDELTKNIIFGFKYYDKTFLAKILAPYLHRLIHQNQAEIDLIIPVPMHPLKIIYRRYNQAALLTKEVGKLLAKKIDLFSLRKAKFTKAQVSLNLKDRRTNIKGSFAVVNEDIKDKTILLIDDVITTNATINECAKILKKHGAKKVIILSVARVITS